MPLDQSSFPEETTLVIFHIYMLVFPVLALQVNYILLYWNQITLLCSCFYLNFLSDHSTWLFITIVYSIFTAEWYTVVCIYYKMLVHGLIDSHVSWHLHFGDLSIKMLRYLVCLHILVLSLAEAHGFLVHRLSAFSTLLEIEFFKIVL
jgi:hypothetical protein